MAQTGFTPIQLYSTSTAAAAPVAGNLTNSTLGSELAINITDGKLFYKDNTNAVQVIGWKTVPTTAGGTGLTTYTAGDLSYYATGTTFTKLAIGTTGQILTSTGSAPQWTTLSGVAVTTFSAGTTGFTPNSATSGAVTLAGTLITSNGGTGLNSYTAGDLSYYASGTALTKLAIGASGRFLSSTGSAPQWSAPAALTEVDDTNVTMTLGGTPSTALLSSVSMTLGWTGTLAVGRGGTGLSTLATGLIPYGNGTSAFSSSANLQFNGTNLAVGGSFTTTVSSGIAINNATAGNFPGLEIQTAGVTRLFFNANNAASYISSVGTNPLVFFTNSGERARITSAGDVGIGTASPSYRLQVAGGYSVLGQHNTTTLPASSSGVSFSFNRSAGSAETNIVNLFDNAALSFEFLQKTGASTANRLYQIASTSHVFFTADTERMRIDSSGNVGIGTTANASAILDAQSTTKGVRMPNMTTTQKNAISSPAAGLVIFDTTLAKLCVYSGAAWQTITSV